MGRVGLEQVKEALHQSPRGMTISAVSEKLQISRNSASKYLEILLTSGEAELRTFGRSKIYRASRSLPLSTALSLSSELIVFIDENLRVVEVNDQFLQFTGRERAQILGCTLDSVDVDLLGHRDILLNIKDALRGKEFLREISLARGNETYYFSVKLIPMRSKGCQGRIALIYQNITARKKAEIALKESEARYRAVVEDQTYLVCRMLPDTTITFVNDAWCLYFRLRKEDVPGRKLFDMVSPRDRDVIRRDLDRVRPDKTSFTVDRNMASPDGRPRWLQSTYRGIYDDRGQLTGVQIAGHDITDRVKAEIALKEREAQYRAVVEDQTDMIFRFLPDMTLTFANRTFCQYTGTVLDRLAGRKLADILVTDNYVKISGELKRIRFEKPSLTATHEMEMSDSTRRWMQITLRGIFDEGRRLREYQLVAKDVTEQKRAELALQESEEKFRACFDQLPIGACIMSLGFRFLQVNPELCHILGYAEDELLVMSIDSITCPADHAADRELAAKLVAGEIAQYHVEKRYICKDGRVTWVRKHARLVKDQSGRPLYFLSLFEEITERKAIDESLRLTQFTVDHSLEGILRIGNDGQLLYANGAVCRMLGYTRDQILSMKAWDINPTLNRITCLERLDESKKNESIVYDTVHRTCDKRLIPLEVNLNHIDYGKDDIYCAFLRYATDRRKFDDPGRTDSCPAS